jgi:hypothetical protein
MALLAEGYTPSNQQIDYSASNQARQQLVNQQRETWMGIENKAANYANAQKEMAQKEKQMAAQIKGSMSLLDSVKAIYPDFADQVDSTKMQLSDPSISSLDKMAIASNIEGVLNMMRTERQQQLSNSRYEAARAAAGGGSGGSSPPAGGAPQDFYNK